MVLNIQSIFFEDFSLALTIFYTHSTRYTKYFFEDFSLALTIFYIHSIYSIYKLLFFLKIQFSPICIYIYFFSFLKISVEDYDTSLHKHNPDIIFNI